MDHLFIPERWIPDTEVWLKAQQTPINRLAAIKVLSCELQILLQHDGGRGEGHVPSSVVWPRGTLQGKGMSGLYKHRVKACESEALVMALRQMTKLALTQPTPFL